MVEPGAGIKLAEPAAAILKVMAWSHGFPAGRLITSARHQSASIQVFLNTQAG